MTNQAIQVLQRPYITNTYGGGIQCQGPTRNFTPYVTGTASAAKPYEPYYDDPVYDISDNFGAFDDNGNPIGDGIIDNPGRILFHKKTRTGQKDNFSLGIGFSMTWSTPTDKKLQDLCKTAAASNIQLMQQAHANKRFDFEIARLKNCGELMQKESSFKPGTEMAKVCADVMVVNKNYIAPHTHPIPYPSTYELRGNFTLFLASIAYLDSTGVFFPRIAAIFLITFLTVGLTALSTKSANGFANSADVVATTAMPPVVVIDPAVGIA